jgi:hypothetical protein
LKEGMMTMQADLHGLHWRISYICASFLSVFI